MSETNRVTDEGSYNDGSYGFERLLTTGLRQSLSPRGALIEHVCLLERSGEIPRNRNENNRARIHQILARGGSAPYNRNGTTRARGGSLARAGSAPYNRNGTTRARGGSPPSRKTKRLPFAAEVCRFIICSYVRMRIYLHHSPHPTV